MSEIQVEFTVDNEEEIIRTEDTPDFPVKVGVAELLFEDQGGNLENMTEEDKKEFDKFIHTVTPQEAVEEAISVIECAPAFDNVDVFEVTQKHVSVNVNYLDVKNISQY